MRTSWTVAILMLFFFGTAISMTLEKLYAGTGIADIFFVLMRPDFTAGGGIPIIGFFIVVWEWIQALWSVFWWDYSFFVGVWAIFKYLGWCLSIGIIVSIIMAIRGVGSS